MPDLQTSATQDEKTSGSGARDVSQVRHEGVHYQSTTLHDNPCVGQDTMGINWLRTPLLGAGVWESVAVHPSQLEVVHSIGCCLACLC